MKIVFIAPVRANSAIAQSTKAVVDALKASGQQVSIVSSEINEVPKNEQLDFDMPTSHWQSAQANSVIVNSIIIYQIGDNFQLHAGAIEHLAKNPGVIILHDAFVGNLFDSWVASNPHHAYYEKSQSDTIWDEGISIQQQDLGKTLGFVLQNATAVIVHSEWARSIAQRITDVSVHLLPLAWNPNFGAEKSLREDFTKTIVTTIGNINGNKRCDSVIEALENFYNENIEYHVVGKIAKNEKVRLEKLARERKVILKIFGEVPHELLESKIREATLVSNLRRPVLEGASASLLDALSIGKAVLVSDSGHYSELPNNVVIKIDPQNEVAELAREIRRLVDEPYLLAELEENSKKYFELMHDTNAYAANLLEISKDSIKNLDYIALRSETRRSSVKKINDISNYGVNSAQIIARKLFRRAGIKKATIALIRGAAKLPWLVSLIRGVYGKVPKLQKVINKLIFNAQI